MTYRSPSRSATAIHAEWLGLLDVSGPFLSAAVLADTDGFRQGPPQASDEGALRRDLANYYEQWLANSGHRQPDRAVERAWLKVVIEDVLEWGELALEGQAIPPGLTFTHGESRETIAPDLVFRDGEGKVRVLVQRYPSGQALTLPIPNARWVESPANRMAGLLRQTGVRLGLVTNGEQWMLVNAVEGEPAGFATWLAGLWFDEHATLLALRALLGVERLVGVADEETLEAILARSAAEQAGVTIQLGDQVRQAIELLVEGIDREDATRRGALLEGIPDAQVYEAAITVMMRLVFLLFAEDQQPPLIGGDDQVYEGGYSVSGLVQDLEAVEEEVLEQRRDAWPRLLATFRLVHAGSDHDQMRQPAYGGSLFDPDRFPFLEGRAGGTAWADFAARPLPIDNRTVLHMLQAIQYLEVRGLGRQRLSFRALDVEQIGHVYEQLLEHTATRADGLVLGLTGTMKKGVKDEPEIALADLEAWRAGGDATLLANLKEATGKSESAFTRALSAEPDLFAQGKLRTACGSDEEIFRRVLPFAGLIRLNRAGRHTVIRAGGLYVTTGSDRSTTGAHYTPRSLTEPIVQYTLEPLVYDGPAEGKPREEWTLLPPKALLSLNICDPAMGSGAFLVQACRWLAERLVESWAAVAGAFAASVAQGGEPVRISPDGSLSRGNPAEELLPADPAERLAIARRLVADHCLYGVDVNPLAVDMAKLSLWLVTLQANRPFTFLDHRLRCGDSLLGIGNIDQVRSWSLAGKRDSRQPGLASWFNRQVQGAIEQGIELHRRIEATPVTDVHDIERQADLLKRAEQVMGLVGLGADLLVGSALVADKKRRDPVRLVLRDRYSVQMDALQGLATLTPEGRTPVLEGLRELRAEAERLLDGKRPFHWPLEFPETFVNSSTHESPGGFSAIVGNPPFLGGQKLTGAFGTPFRDYLVDYLASGKRGSADLCAYFLLRCGSLLSPRGGMGVLATNTIAQGDTREVGLDALVADGFTIPRAVQSQRWPGAAALEVAHLWLRRGEWNGGYTLEHQPVRGITPYLTVPGRAVGNPYRLAANAGKSFQGSIVLGKGFVLEPDEALAMIERDPRNKDVLFPYLNGEDLNSRPDQSPSRWVINFHDWPLERAMEYPGPFDIVRTRAKPERDRLADGDATAKDRARRWWQFGRPTLALYRTIAGLDRVLVRAQVSSTWAFAFVPIRQVLDAKLIVFATDTHEHAGLIQSAFHQAWAQEFSSTMKADMSYTPQRVYETLPFYPEVSARINECSSCFFDARQTICNAEGRGLTWVGHRLNDQHEQVSDFANLRQALIDLDNAVAAAYGWDDLDLEHGFHETKQGVRFTISEAARREVLDRLRELNHQRYAEEVAQGLHEKSGKGKAKKQRATQPGLL